MDFLKIIENLAQNINSKDLTIMHDIRLLSQQDKDEPKQWGFDKNVFNIKYKENPSVGFKMTEDTIRIETDNKQSYSVKTNPIKDTYEQLYERCTIEKEDGDTKQYYEFIRTIKDNGEIRNLPIKVRVTNNSETVEIVSKETEEELQSYIEYAESEFNITEFIEKYAVTLNNQSLEEEKAKSELANAMKAIDEEEINAIDMWNASYKLKQKIKCKVNNNEFINKERDD